MVCLAIIFAGKGRERLSYVIMALNLLLFLGGLFNVAVGVYITNASLLMSLVDKHENTGSTFPIFLWTIGGLVGICSLFGMMACYSCGNQTTKRIRIYIKTYLIMTFAMWVFLGCCAFIVRFQRIFDDKTLKLGGGMCTYM